MYLPFQTFLSLNYFGGIMTNSHVVKSVILIDEMNGMF